MKIFITRKIPDRGIKLLQDRGYELVVSPHTRVLTRDELIEMGKGVDGIISQLTDKIDGSVVDAWGKQLKVIANYAVGYDNLNTKEIAERGVVMTNTPEVLTETVAEHTFALMLAIAHRIAESDRFSRAGKYHGWAPELLLGTDVSHKTLGIVGLGRIGSRVAHHAVKGFDMRVLYYDVKRNENFEKEFNAEFRENVDDIFKEADFISIHVPLLPTTQHLVNEIRLKLMKPTAYLINTSRGPIVDEAALRDALKNNGIKGAAIDVWEHEPELTPGLSDLENIIITPHIASATEETRQKMGELAAKNIIEVLEGRPPVTPIKI
ncbi:MAG: D-glycerate dehydrogenase [bacterium]|nr:D-glycerate dehydrogenase [bacterium]